MDRSHSSRGYANKPPRTASVPATACREQRGRRRTSDRQSPVCFLLPRMQPSETPQRLYLSCNLSTLKYLVPELMFIFYCLKIIMPASFHRRARDKNRPLILPSTLQSRNGKC